MGRKPPSDEGAPYAKYAFLNVYNLSLLASAATLSAATGHWWVGLCAGAAEAIWMLFAPDSRVLRAAWFDPKWSAEEIAAVRARLAEKYARLPPQEQQRALAVSHLQQRIDQVAVENPSFTVELLKSDLVRLNQLVEDYLDMAHACSRCELHLQNFEVEALDRRILEHRAAEAHLPEHDPRRRVSVQNLEVLERRRQRYDQLVKRLQTGRGQMELMENTLRLLADDIVAMRDASELGERLQQLRLNVEAVRETTVETEDLLAFEDEPEPAARAAR